MGASLFVLCMVVFIFGVFIGFWGGYTQGKKDGVKEYVEQHTGMNKPHRGDQPDD